MLRIISWLQATDSLTLGNYIGSIKSLVELQNENNLFYLLVTIAQIFFAEGNSLNIFW